MNGKIGTKNGPTRPRTISFPDDPLRPERIIAGGQPDNSDPVLLRVTDLAKSNLDVPQITVTNHDCEKMDTPISVADSIGPPDGGFGWAVVFASFMCNVIVDGIIFSFGILLPAISTEFQENKATTAWIGSLQTGFYLIVGPLVSALAQRYDCRKMTIIGSILAAIGFVLSHFAPNVITLYVTFGLLGGIGFGFVFLPAIVTVGYYFEKKRAFATGIAVCGSGVGTFVMPPIIQYLMAQFGWRTTLLYLAGITLFCAAFGSLFRPLKMMMMAAEDSAAQLKPDAATVPVSGPVFNQKPLLMRIKEARAAEWARSEEELTSPPSSPNQPNGTGSTGAPPPPYSEVLLNISSREALPTPPTSPTFKKSFDSNRCLRSRSITVQEGMEPAMAATPKPKRTTKPRDEMLYSNLSLVVLPQSRSFSNLNRVIQSNSTLGGQPDEPAPPNEWRTFLAGFDLSLLKRPSFVLLAVSGFLCLVGFFIPFIYLTDRAKLLGISPERCAFILSVIGMTNTIGRVLCGWASDRSVNALMMNNIALTVGGIATIISPIIFNTYSTLIVYGSVFGVCVASFATLRSVITVELLGLEKLTSAFGLLLLFQGLAVTIGSPIAGWFFDMTGSYDYSFYLSGSAIALSGIMCYPLNAIARWERKCFDDEMPSSSTVADEAGGFREANSGDCVVDDDDDYDADIDDGYYGDDDHRQQQQHHDHRQN